MAKGKGKNIIFIGKDGKVAIGSNDGDLMVLDSVKNLPADIKELIARRQAEGKLLNDALAKANFPIKPSQDIDVIDPSGVLSKPRKKAAKKR
jgi:hypothetical protein